MMKPEAGLLDKAKLTVEQQRLVLVSTSQRLDYALIRDALLLQYPEHKPTPPINGFYQDRSKGGGKAGKDKGKGTFTNSAAAANPAGSKGHGHNNFKKSAYVTEHSEVAENIPGDRTERLRRPFRRGMRSPRRTSTRTSLRSRLTRATPTTRTSMPPAEKMSHLISISWPRFSP